MQGLTIFGTSMGMRPSFTSIVALIIIVALYPCGTPQTYRDLIIADSETHMQSPSRHYIQNAASVSVPVTS